jgi:hypothetical protein
LLALAEGSLWVRKNRPIWDNEPLLMILVKIDIPVDSIKYNIFIVQPVFEGLLLACYFYAGEGGWTSSLGCDP